MILIDKDKLIHSLEIIPCKDSEERATVNWVIDEIDEKPRVRAIPIEWFKSKIDAILDDHPNGNEEAEILCKLLYEWEKENAEVTD